MIYQDVYYMLYDIYYIAYSSYIICHILDIISYLKYHIFCIILFINIHHILDIIDHVLYVVYCMLCSKNINDITCCRYIQVYSSALKSVAACASSDLNKKKGQGMGIWQGKVAAPLPKAERQYLSSHVMLQVGIALRVYVMHDVRLQKVLN